MTSDGRKNDPPDDTHKKSSRRGKAVEKSSYIDPAKTPKEAQVLIDELLRGVISDQNNRRLIAILKRDPDIRAFFQQQSLVHSSLVWMLGNIEGQDSSIKVDPLFIADCLRETEASITLDRATKQEEAPSREIGSSSTSRTRYGSTKRSKNATIMAYGIGGILAAAIMLVGIVSLDPFSAKDQQRIVGGGNTNTDTGAYFATITAQKDASWSTGSIADGEVVQPGIQLVLDEGFAQITTSRGAIANILAPAIFEVVDAPNALEMQKGVLLGEVKTEAAKGFVVRTPGMIVTDLGTEFGIYVSETGECEVHVIEGKVQAVAPNETIPMELTAGQSARVSNANTAVEIVNHDTSRFMPLKGTTIPVAATGSEAKIDQVDPQWQIVAVDTQQLDTPRPVLVGGSFNRLKVVPPGFDRSQWIRWVPPARERTAKECVYLVQTTVDLEKSISESGAHVVLNYLADNELRAIHINGNRVELPKVNVRDNFTLCHQAAVADYWKAGSNIVEFEVVNVRLDRADGGDAGLRLTLDIVIPGTPFSKQP